jgi:single-strand DNA-binding protein
MVYFNYLACMNKVILVGRMGKDPVVRSTEKTKIANVTLATSDYKGEAEWHNVVAFGKTAEIVESYTRKGSQIGVEGRLQTRQWTNKEGQERYTTEVVVDRLELLSSKREEEALSKSNSGFSPKENDLPF